MLSVKKTGSPSGTVYSSFCAGRIMTGITRVPIRDILKMNHTFRRAVPHYSDQQFDGRQRVVIENVTPELDGGKYPANWQSVALFIS